MRLMGCSHCNEEERERLQEGIFYSEEVYERVALYIVEHGGRVQVERVDPGWVFHKVTFSFRSERRIGGGDSSPIYRYTLVDGGTVLVQTLRGRGFVPGHPNDYWTSLHIYREDDDGRKGNTR